MKQITYTEKEIIVCMGQKGVYNTKVSSDTIDEVDLQNAITPPFGLTLMCIPWYEKNKHKPLIRLLVET